MPYIADTSAIATKPTRTPITTITGPVRILFPHLPAGVTLANPSGFTASGIPFITVHFNQLTVNGPPLRVRINIHNPNLTVPTSFFLGFPIEVIGGQFAAIVELPQLKKNGNALNGFRRNR